MHNNSKGNTIKQAQFVNMAQLLRDYRLTKSLLARFFPEPELRRNPLYPHAAPMKCWNREVVEQILASPDFQAAFQQVEKLRAAHVMEDSAQALLSKYDVSHLVESAKRLTRRFVLHVGPTNSGKTYHALQALKEAGNGTYLGPLRLLALEVFDTLNMDGYPCTLLTGEEYQPIPNAKIVASTIELCDFSAHHAVAVIDEAQLIADPERGAHWTKAIFCVQADEVHICLAPEALPLIQSLVSSFGSPMKVIRHERLTPLVFSGVVKNLNSVKPGDALITFSRKGVLGIAAALEAKGTKASVIYGALPPASRREEVRRFTEGESSVVVATDAIGMGVSLPIRRVIFCQTQKYDGRRSRPLTAAEVKQIAGRAGRFGKYDVGEVLTMSDPKLISSALKQQTAPIKRLTIPFPGEAVQSSFSIGKLLDTWEHLPEAEGFRRASMETPAALYKKLMETPLPKGVSKAQIFEYITCPVDTSAYPLVGYWKRCCQAIMAGKPIPDPFFIPNSLDNCELLYKALDIRHQLLRKIGVEDDYEGQRVGLCEQINTYLKDDKRQFLPRCSRCGKPLRINATYGICERCYSKLQYEW